MKKIKYVFLFICLFCGVLIPHFADAVSITVRRVVFDGPKRAQVITVINNMNKEQTYRVGWRHFLMTEHKSLTPLKEGDIPPKILPSKDFVRFAPRRFTLPAGGSQQVRMMVRMPPDVEDGEYRSHLSVSPEANVEEFRARVSREQKGKTGTFMEMLAGMTIPVIVRRGNLNATGAVEGLSVRRDGGEIVADFTLLREGTRSVYGDLDLICNADEGPYLIKFLRGVSIYTEVNRRTFSMKFPELGGKPRCANLTLKYTEVDASSGDVLGVFAKAKAPVL